MMTSHGKDISGEMFRNYLSFLINQFFKILPLKEAGEPTLSTHIRSLLLELVGCSELICRMEDDAMFMRLICTLQYMLDHECDTGTVKREVFKSISILKKLQSQYFGEERV